MHNVALIERGYAKPLVTAPNDKHSDSLFDARLVAEKRGKGIWSDELTLPLVGPLGAIPVPLATVGGGVPARRRGPLLGPRF